MVTKATKRKVADFWNNECACCRNKDYLEYHHIIPKAKGGTDEFDNLILLCGECHAIIHGRRYNKDKPNCNTSISYEAAIPILEQYFSNQIGTRETKERLRLSQKTHLSESALVKRYKREHNITDFYNNVDLCNSKRREQNDSDNN